MADENVIQTNIVATSNMTGLVTDLNRVSTALAKLQQQVLASNKGLATQISVMNRTFAETLRSTGQFSTHFVSLASDVDKFGNQLDKGQMKLGQFFRAYGQHTKTTGGLIRDLAKQQVMLQNAVMQPIGRNAEGLMQYNVHIPKGLDLIKNKSAIARQELMIMNKVVQEGAGQLINWGKNTQWAGRQLTVGLTVPMAAFGKAAADAFKQADEQLTRLTKVYGGLAATSSADLAKIRKDVAATATELSKAYGANFTETLGLAADIAATGKEGNELLGSIQETTRLAVLGEVDRQDAMKATLAIQSAFKSNTKELAESINFLNAVENQTSTTLNDLVEAIPKAGPIIKGLGGDVKDLALYLTAMREGGISASEGANALKSGLASLINPTKVAVERFKGFGIDILGIVNENAGNVTNTLLALQSALDTLNPLQKQQAIEQLFGKFQFSRLNALFENLGKQGSQTLQVIDLMKASTSDLANIAGRELTQVTESAAGKYKRAIEGLRADLAGIGDQFLKIATTIINIVDGIIKFADKLPNPIKQLLSFMGLLTATAGPLIMLTGVLGNFFGYIIKGVYHFKALFKGAEGWKLLTPEILAATRAGDLAEDTFYSDAKAAAILKQALDGLSASYSVLDARINAGVIGTNPMLTQASSQIAMSGREVNPSHPLLSPKDTRSMSHLNPVAGMTAEQRLAQTLFGTVPGAPKVNQKIGKAPQIYATGDLPPIEGLTRVSGVSTGVVAEEAAKWHALTGSLAMQSQDEIVKLKSEVAATGLITDELSSSYNALLPEMTRLTQNAAQKSAGIVAELQAGKLNVDQARAKIIALNAEIEAMMVSATSTTAANLGRTVDPTRVPLLNQPVVDPKTGKSNMKELLKPGRTRGIFTSIAQALGVKTYGAPYSTETTRPRRLAMGGVGIQKFANGYIGVRAGMKAAQMLRAFQERSSKIGGYKTVDRRSARRGAEAGAGVSYGELSKRNAEIYKTKEFQDYNITPTRKFEGQDDEYIIHGMVPSFTKRTAGLEMQGSSPILKQSQYGNYDLTMSRQVASKDAIQIVPTQFIKNRKGFNEGLRDGTATAADFRPVEGSDMMSLLLFLKDQGLPPHQAKLIAGRAANVLNKKILSHNGPIDEALFGKFLNIASVRAIQSGAKPSMVQDKNVFGYDAFSRNRGSRAIGLKEDAPWGVPGYESGVTKLPGFGGGDIVPALLEPGESVVTKTGTAANEGALTLMNKGISVDKMLGFNKGVVGLKVAQMQMSGWLPGQASSRLNYDPMTGQLLPGRVPSKMGTGFASQIAGSMAGGAVGGAVGGPGGTAIGSIAGMFAPQLIGKMVTLAKNAGGFLNIMIKVAKVLKSLTIPGAVVTVLALAGKKLFDMKRAAEEAGKANRLAFGGTSTAYATVGIKNYKSLTDRLKEYNDQLELNRAKIKSTYESYTKSGPNGITFTIKELSAAIKNAKQNQKEYVDAFNNIDTSRVQSYASSLKAQFVAMGMSASEAANQIYAIIKASDKTSQALEAVSSTTFKSITDQVSGLKVLLNNLGSNLGNTFNAEEFAVGIDALVNGVLAYADSLEGTKDKNGQVLDQTDAMVKAIDQVGKLQGKNNKLNSEQLLEIKKTNIAYAGILGTAETLQSVTAKIVMYQSGMSEIVNLAAMGAKQAVEFARNMNVVQDTMTKVFSNTSSDNPLAGLAAGLKAAQDNALKQSKNLDALQKFDKKIYEQKIKQQEKLIDKIEKEREARLKLLDVQERSANFETDVKSAQIRYQEALAAGDMAQAAQEQLNIQRLTSDRQRELARNAINDKYDREREKAEKEIERLQAIINKNADATVAANKSSVSAASSSETIKGFMDGINNILMKYIGTDGKMSKSVSELDRQAISNIINEMKKSSDQRVKNQGIELEKKAQGGSLEVTSSGPSYNKSFEPNALLGGLISYLDKNGEAANKAFPGAVSKFAAAVDKFSGGSGKAYVAPTDSQKNKLPFAKDTTNMLFQANGKKIAIGGGSGTWESTYIDATGKGWKFVGYQPNDNKIPKDYEKHGSEWDIPKAATGGLITHYGLGGGVYGPGTGTSDSIPAMLSNGEYVINAKSAAAVGYPVLDKINKFAMGGMVKYDIPKMNMGGVAKMSGQSSVVGDTINMGNIVFHMAEAPSNPRQFGRDLIEGIKSGNVNRVYRT